MYEYKCPICGKVKYAKRHYQVRTFCSKECATKAREKDGNGAAFYGECIFNPIGVTCYRRDCRNCGWNPDVAEARLEAFAENGNIKVKVEVPDIYVGKWISVDDRMPDDGDQVLVRTKSRKIVLLHYRDGKWCWVNKVDATHWMPLPSVPEV